MFLIGFVLKFVAKIHYPCHSAKKNGKNVKRVGAPLFDLGYNNCRIWYEAGIPDINSFNFCKTALLGNGKNHIYRC